MKIRMTVHVVDNEKKDGKIKNTLSFIGNSKEELYKFLLVDLKEQHEVIEYYFTNIHKLSYYAKE